MKKRERSRIYRVPFSVYADESRSALKGDGQSIIDAVSRDEARRLVIDLLREEGQQIRVHARRVRLMTSVQP